MFQGCTSLKELNISHFNFNNTIVNNMFSKCQDVLKTKIRDLNLGLGENAFQEN